MRTSSSYLAQDILIQGEVPQRVRCRSCHAVVDGRDATDLRSTGSLVSRMIKGSPWICRKCARVADQSTTTAPVPETGSTAPATERQLDLIARLAHQLGISIPPRPKTKETAHALIQRLRARVKPRGRRFR